MKLRVAPGETANVCLAAKRLSHIQPGASIQEFKMAAGQALERVPPVDRSQG